MSKTIFLPSTVIFLCCLLLFSCQPSGEDQTKGINRQNPENLLSIVPSKAPLHAEPAADSPVLQSLGKGEFVVWEGKESETKDQQIVDGQKLEGNWLQVRTRKGQNGWMFSGTLTNAPDAQVDAPGQNTFATFLSELDPTIPEATRSAIGHFKKSFPANSEQPNDEAFKALQQFFSASADSMHIRLYGTVQDDELYNFVEGVELTPETKQFRDQLLRSGFKIRTSEGMPYVQASPDYLLQNLRNYLSPAMKSFQNQMVKETEQGFLEDAGLVIPFSTLADRMLWKEKFLIDHQDFIYRKEIKDILNEEMSILLLGVDNTPAFDFETGGYKADLKDLLENIINEHPETRIARTIGEFLDLLEKEGNKNTPALQEFVNQL